MCIDCPEQLARDRNAAFPAFVRHHQDLVHGMAMRLSGGHSADAQDLAQEALVRAYRALLRYDDQRVRDLRPRGWLAAIVLNLARNRSRRTTLGGASLEAAAGATGPTRDEPESIVERREAAIEWRARLDALPEAHRRALELRHVDGLTYPELAVALGRPMGTVKSDVHRGIERLRQVLAAEERP